jgi:hypothetical protein
MSSSIFNDYSSKGCLKFYKLEDEELKLKISISISSNHQLDNNLVDSINEFLNKLLINDYENEEAYKEKQQSLELLKQQMKQQDKVKKQQLKTKKLNNDNLLKDAKNEEKLKKKYL